VQVPVLELDRSFVQFSPRFIQSPKSDPEPIVIRNTGDATLYIRKIEVQGTHKGDFHETHPDVEVPGRLAPGQEGTVTVWFKPTDEGSRRAELVVKGDANTGAEDIVRTVLLGGAGKGSEQYLPWELKAPEGRFSYASGVSNSGQVVGNTSRSDNQQVGVIWEGRRALPLPEPLSGSIGEAKAISPDGKQVAGWVIPPNSTIGQAFFWDRNAKPTLL
jgi:hypothetical protein